MEVVSDDEDDFDAAPLPAQAHPPARRRRKDEMVKN